MNGQSQVEQDLAKATRSLNDIRKWLETKGSARSLRGLSSQNWKDLDSAIQNFVDQARRALQSMGVDTLTEASEEFGELYDAFVDFDKTFPEEPRIDRCRRELEMKKDDIDENIAVNITKAKSRLDAIQRWLRHKGLDKKQSLNLSALGKQDSDDLNARIKSFVDQANSALGGINKNTKANTKDEFNSLYDAFVSFDTTFPPQDKIDNLRKFLDAKKTEFYSS